MRSNQVVRLKSGEWRNLPLWEEYQSGRLLLVKRPPDKEGQKLDDLTLIKTATDIGAYVCSNDKFRDHMKDKKLGFLNTKRVKAWAAERKFDFRFHVATGLSEELLAAMVAASGFVARVGIKEYLAGRVLKSAVGEGVEAEEEEGDQGMVPCPTKAPNPRFIPALNPPPTSLRAHTTRGVQVEAEADEDEEWEWEARGEPKRRLHADFVPYHVMPPKVLPVVFEPVPR